MSLGNLWLSPWNNEKKRQCLIKKLERTFRSRSAAFEKCVNYQLN